MQLQAEKVVVLAEVPSKQHLVELEILLQVQGMPVEVLLVLSRPRPIRIHLPGAVLRLMVLSL